jgi:hypothetical protein
MKETLDREKICSEISQIYKRLEQAELEHLEIIRQNNKAEVSFMLAHSVPIESLEKRLAFLKSELKKKESFNKIFAKHSKYLNTL